MFVKQNFDFLRIQSRRKISIQMFKTRYDLFQSNNKKQIVIFLTSIAKLKKRFITIINENENDIATFIKKI